MPEHLFWWRSHEVLSSLQFAIVRAIDLVRVKVPFAPPAIAERVGDGSGAKKSFPHRTIKHRQKICRRYVERVLIEWANLIPFDFASKAPDKLPTRLNSSSEFSNGLIVFGYRFPVW